MIKLYVFSVADSRVCINIALAQKELRTATLTWNLHWIILMIILMNMPGF